MFSEDIRRRDSEGEGAVTEQLTLMLKTLTPLWTRGVFCSMDRIHETGIPSSLRWWYERRPQDE